MTSKTLKPSRQYLYELCVVILGWGLVALACSLVAVWLIVGGMIADKELPPSALLIALGLAVLANLAWVILALILAGPYYRSISYELTDEEILVRVGIWTKSVKYVPYRTITNIVARRGLLDRTLFDIGRLDVQTAGMSGQARVEAKLVGLAEYEEVYDIVRARLQRFRSSLAPTQTEEEPVPALAPAPSDDVLREILREVRAIRERLSE